jgi:HK97 family phage major capsid protein
MPTLLQLRDARNKALTDAQTIMVSADNKPTPEQRTSVEAMIADADRLESDIAVAERIEKFDAEQRSFVAPPRGGVSADERSDGERRAFGQFLRSGGRMESVQADLRTYLQPAETRDMTSTGAAGAVIPQAFSRVLVEAQAAWGDLLNIVNVVPSDTGAPTKIPVSNDLANILYEVGDEVGSTQGGDPTLTSVMLSTSLLTAKPVIVPLATMQDSAFDVEKWLRNEFAKRYFRGMSQLICTGSTSGNIASILALPAGAIVQANPAVGDTDQHEIKYNDLVSLYGALDPAYEQSSVFAMNSTTRAYLLGITNTLGDPILQKDVLGNPFSTLFGRPIKLVQAFPNRTTAKLPILFGDFEQGYMLKTVNPGLQIVRANERYIDQWSTGFFYAVRAGGVLTDAGSHPIVGLATK